MAAVLAMSADPSGVSSAQAQLRSNMLDTYAKRALDLLKNQEVKKFILKS